ncbi:hypothetical protein GCM10008908_12300 [Clostridium subterminale]|uniref:DUF3955 domain-containing protein n=1 Tax=Clostridium subterminale TaxID=1550 RepID=A0ABN1KL19_CLOSU
MKKYLVSLISIFISIICLIAYNVIGSEVLADGTLVEPFFLIPIAWLFVFIALISGLIVFAISCVHKSKQVQ